MGIAFELNGARLVLDVDPGRVLLDVLREEVGLTSVRGTCGIGLCGTCTVVIDGRTAASCIMPCGLVDGRSVTTIEGVAPDDVVSRAFEESHAFQCGYCTPAMILAARQFLAENGDPTDAEIADAMAGNLCRCGCYLKIADAIRLAAARLAGRRVAQESVVP